MTERKSKLIPGLAIAACVACCTIPLAGLVLVGASTAAIATFFASDQFKDVLVCGIPLLLIITGYFLYTRRKKATACCEAPNSGCSPNQCSIDTNKN